MNTLRFTGHDTFHCRQFWLKKGFDHINEGRVFNDDAVIDLGIGRNMVTAVRFWVKAFGLESKDKPSELAQKIFNDEGFDPYIEDVGTLWLLHYELVKCRYSSIYAIIFNEFRRQKVEFTKDHLTRFINRKCEQHGVNLNPSSLKRDIDVFFNNYMLPESKKEIEDSFSGLLYELNLLSKLEKTGADKSENRYKIENRERPSLPAEIVLFCILKNVSDEETTFSFKDLLEKDDSVGRIFALSANGLMNKIQTLLGQYPNHFVWSDAGGIQTLQIKKKLNHWSVLEKYYAA